MSRAHQDRAYWQRLSRDAPTAIAVGGALVACGAACLGLIALLMPGGPQISHRSNPIYWAILIPYAWWGSSLGFFQPRAARTLVPALFVGPIVAAICLGAALSRDTRPTTFIVVLIVALVSAGAGALSYPRSMLKREGPAR